ncbi:Na+/H+ antiporter subunit E [Hyphobacterium sp. HN65]|uniref:Na+/H+ antiporter subunit E n=1 Tax=Hyphobacterium lacteum TaxID=3116575 RepID=A0ABU7LSY1_9PROT|nr:Na+/H+ antiporter subunit E [Hyphobacterium sp. HN65]MEE2527027.1 Na+/H+ antiporter subunit E [Hyphobacterium sp. HN65]
MIYGVSLSLVLALLWWVLSGYDKITLLAFGAASVVIAMVLVFRMRILDRETAPFVRLPTLIPYYIWLGGEIAKANFDVIRAALKPEIDITPRLVRVPVKADTDLSRCIFANSITLTPGTVTVEIEDDAFLVHALDTSFTSPDGFAEMNLHAARATDGGAS